jgi:hypothetical protein
MTLLVAALSGLLSLAGPEPVSDLCTGTPVDTSVEAFVACARAATDKYRDHAAAVRDGYRRIGGDFPGMGEHWIRVNLLFDRSFDPAKPELLSYALVDGRRRLLGVAYAVPLVGDDLPPRTPAGLSAWHDHSGTIDEETVLPQHHTHGAAGRAPRLAMLHAWIWSSNAGGMFAADNWDIPALRLGVTPPAAGPAATGKTLSLLVGGREYLERAIAASTTLSGAERARVDRAFDRAVAAAEATVKGLAGPAIGDADGLRLAEIWAALWADIDAVVSDDARERLAILAVR